MAFPNWRYSHISTATTTNLTGTEGNVVGVARPVPRNLGRVNINSFTAGATITIYDGPDASFPVIAIITTTAVTVPGSSILYDIETINGLAIVTTGTLDITVSYR
jgi:hypothetical protein